LLEQLKEQDVPVKNVSFLNNSEQNPSYLIHFEKTSNVTVQKLNIQHRVVDLVVVKWQKFNKSKKKFSQCHNCQEFGHAARNCGQNYRCVKCVEIHEPGKCSKDRSKDVPCCVNCGGAHPANNRQCKAFNDYKIQIENLKKVSKSNKVVPRVFTSTPAPWISSQNTRSTQVQQNYVNNFPALNINNPSFTNRLNNISIQDNATLSDLQNEFNSIPNIKDTLKLYKEMIFKLKSTNCHNTRISIILEYTSP
jgi:hypothetical protein